MVLVKVVAVPELDLHQIPQTSDESSETRHLVLNGVHDVLDSELLDRPSERVTDKVKVRSFRKLSLHN